MQRCTCHSTLPLTVLRVRLVQLAALYDYEYTTYYNDNGHDYGQRPRPRP